MGGVNSPPASWPSQNIRLFILGLCVVNNFLAFNTSSIAPPPPVVFCNQYYAVYGFPPPPLCCHVTYDIGNSNNVKGPPASRTCPRDRSLYEDTVFMV